jgi:hypothetical protein
MMTTDPVPRSPRLLNGFRKSDRLTHIALPEDGRLLPLAKAIEDAMQSKQRAIVTHTCQTFLALAADFYGVAPPTVRVLTSRPLRVYESGWSTELFGDYDPEKNLIRVWMRTAVRKHITSSGTFISTLCHEFCHQLDFSSTGFQIHPTRAGFMNGLLSFTTMRAVHPKSSSFGGGCQKNVFRSIGHGCDMRSEREGRLT